MRILALLAAGLVAATSAAADAPKSSGPDAAAIRQERLAQNAAIVKHDLTAIAAYWTDDVTINRGLGAQLAGKADYLKLFESDAAKSKDEIVYERIPTAIDVSSTWPLAFETGVWKGRAGSATGQVIIEGRYSAQWVKRADRWLIRSEVFVALQGHGPGLQLKATP